MSYSEKYKALVSLVISAAIISTIYIYLMCVLFDLAHYFSFTAGLFSFLELTQFILILIGVIIDYLTKKMTFRYRLIVAAALVIVPGLIYKFLI